MGESQVRVRVMVRVRVKVRMRVGVGGRVECREHRGRERLRREGVLLLPLVRVRVLGSG